MTLSVHPLGARDWMRQAQSSVAGRGVLQAWCGAAAERLASDVCAQADLTEALLAANNDGNIQETRKKKLASSRRAGILTELLIWCNNMILNLHTLAYNQKVGVFLKRRVVFNFPTYL